MLRRRMFVAAFVAALASSLTTGSVLVPSAAASAADDADPSTATYDGDEIELADGSWDGARACAVIGQDTACFDTEAEMNAWLALQPPDDGPLTARTYFGGVQLMGLSCASSLRLYEHGGFGGRVLYLSSRGLWFNLRDFSFDNKTSSFKVGACSAYLAEATYGGGSWYPGGGAYSSVGVMPGSWNDRISSTYVV